ncbi:MAG: hypothetical protein AAGD13_03580 [Pseudomonadota bacterium]
MPRRSWRDLQNRPGGADPGPQSGPRSFRAPGGSDLAEAARLAPDSQLGALMQQREQLERRLQGLSGVPGQDRFDPAFAARFNVASFAERRADEQRWAAQRAGMQERRDALRQQAANPDAVQEHLRQRRQPSGLGPTPLEGRMAGGLPDLPGGHVTTGMGDPRTDVSQILDALPGQRTGVGTRPAPTRSAAGDQVRGLRDRLDTVDRPVQSGLRRARKVTDRIDEVGRPLREIGSQVENYQKQLDDLDSKLEAEGFSEKERAEIRKDVGGDKIDKVGGKLAKANKALAAPGKAVKKVEHGWNQRRQQIEGPMDRFSNYADNSERRLSPETGGSGDLFERMQRNRERALRRQRAAQMQEEQDRRRRERAQENARARRAEEQRDER